MDEPFWDMLSIFVETLIVGDVVPKIYPFRVHPQDFLSIYM
jgi:hypothetical protein